MGDRVGLLVMLGIAIVLALILIVMRPRRRVKGEAEHETLNPDIDAGRVEAVGVPDEDRLVGNPPSDTITPSGEGTALPGAGAGGWTSDARDPLRSSPNDAANSPDES